MTRSARNHLNDDGTHRHLPALLRVSAAAAPRHQVLRKRQEREMEMMLAHEQTKRELAMRQQQKVRHAWRGSAVTRLAPIS